MDVVGRKVENQVQFWSLLGPFFILLSIAVLLFKVSTHWHFPVSALIGIPLCLKWKMKGMAAALGCLFLLAGIGYQNLELDDRYWHVGLSLAMAFSLIVLTLSLEEVQGLVSKLQLESQSRLDNFLLLDEKWKGAEQEWSIEREKSQSEVVSLTQELSKTQEEKQTFYKLAQLAKDELVQVRGQHDQLLQDLLYKKQHIAQLQERLEETELTIQGFVNSDVEKNVQALTEQVTSLEREKEMLKAKIALAQAEGQSCLQEKEQLGRELQNCQEREKLCLIDQQRFQQDKVEQQNAFQALHNKCLVLEQEKNSLFQTQINLQQQYEQMRHLESQHRQTLQQSQLKIHDLEVKLAAEEQQKEALLLVRKEIEELLIHREKQATQREDQYKNHLHKLQDQLEEKEKAEALLKHIQEQAAQKSQQKQQALEEEIEAKNQALAHVQQKVEKLSDELGHQHALVQQTTEQMQRLDNLKLQLEQALQQTQAQLQLNKQTLEEDRQHDEKLPYAPGNTRRIEAMYIQLKEQFQEKCAVLDATRRELFHAHEELLKLQKEYEEEHIFDESLNEKYLQRHLLQVERHYEKMQQQYQQEIEELTQLVECLICSKS